MKEHKPRKPRSKLSSVLLSLFITLLVGFGYFYVSLPALNLQDSNFYVFIFLLCVVFVISALVTSGFQVQQGGGLKEYLRFIKAQCLPVGLLMVALVLVGIVGSIISMPIFRASSYRELLNVQEGDFTTDVQEISFSEIPLLDEDSARYLSTTQMGTIPDMASQFEVSYNSTQINYNSKPVRVVPLEYADLIRWFTNRGNGLPAYIIVDMTSQEVEVKRLPEGQGMKYSPSEPLNRNVMRHLRFSYPTYMFAEPSFEIDEQGQPWWVCPRVVKTIGLFGGTDIQGAVLMNAVTGESVYYEAADVPQWVDRVYLASLIVEQYNYYGTLVHGFLNSVFGQRDVRLTTEGYNYIALNDDVYMFTGVTSATSDQSNLGFLLCNQRTKETKFYTAPGATEQSARSSAQGMVQDLKYTATWPLLLNISGQPTYFLALKDANQLVKMYAMVNVAQFNVVGTGSTVAECEQSYLKLLTSKGLAAEEERVETQVSGTVDEIRSAVMDGDSYYFVRLKGEDVFYSLSAASNPLAVILDVGDRVTIDHAPQAEGETASILDAYTLTVDGKAAPAPVVTPPPSPTPDPDPAETPDAA